MVEKGLDNVPDIPDDFKIEHDRLIYEMEPIVMRLYDIMKSLPNPGTSEIIHYGKFKVKIEENDDRPDNT